MKKLFIMAVISSFAFTSCGGEEKKEDEKKESSASLCECVTADQDNLSDDCKKLKEDWEKEFNAADDATKEEMTKEIMACMDKK